MTTITLAAGYIVNGEKSSASEVAKKMMENDSTVDYITINMKWVIKKLKSGKFKLVDMDGEYNDKSFSSLKDLAEEIKNIDDDNLSDLKTELSKSSGGKRRKSNKLTSKLRKLSRKLTRKLRKF